MRSHSHFAYKENILPIPAKRGLNHTKRVTTQDSQVWEFFYPFPIYNSLPTRSGYTSCLPWTKVHEAKYKVPLVHKVQCVTSAYTFCKHCCSSQCYSGIVGLHPTAGVRVSLARITARVPRLFSFSWQSCVHQIQYLLLPQVFVWLGSIVLPGLRTEQPR